MRRMWVRLSLSFGVVLLVATALMSGAFALLLHQGRIMPAFPPMAEAFVSPLDASPTFFAPDIVFLDVPGGGVTISSGIVVEAFGFEIPIRLFVLLSTSISLTLGLAAGVWVSRSISRPVTRLALAAQAIGDHNLASRVEVKGSQELVDLAQTFNQMAVDLERAEALRVNLVADVAHELRTPLTVLEGNLRAILDGVYDLSEEEVARLYEQTHHLTRLVEDLRELAHAESGRLALDLVAVDMARLATEAVMTFASLAEEKGLQLVSKVSHKLPMTMGDPLRLRQVLHNLISNSIRYTPTGGHIAVCVEADSEEMRLIVRDDGIGIASEDLTSIFNRFHRIDTRHRRGTAGTGLGLAIAMAVMKAHGGSIDVQSPGPDLGSTFTVHLPILTSDGGAAA
jgi:signal transduction histidine kinase